jgi:hypothetical protein
MNMARAIRTHMFTSLIGKKINYCSDKIRWFLIATHNSVDLQLFFSFELKIKPQHW